MALRRITREQQAAAEVAEYVDASQRGAFYGGEIRRLHDIMRRWLRSTDDPAVAKRLLSILKASNARLDKGHQGAPVIFEAE